MKRYDQNFKTEALKLSDDIGVKKACEQLNVNYGRFIFSGTICTAENKPWDNARMESWFATLKKEKIYQLDTTKLTVEKVKTIVWRYTFAYYNTKRVTMVNPSGLPPAVYREKAAAKKGAA